MTDTIRTTATLLGTLFADGQPSGSINPQDARDMILSLAQRQIVVSLSDQVSNLLVGTAVLTFRIAEPITLTDCRLSCSTAPTGSSIIVDVKNGGVSIFSTKPSIAAGSKTSDGGTPCVISTTSLADDDDISVDINQIGSTIAGAGLKLTLLGRRT